MQQDGRPFFSRKLGISPSGQEVPIDFGGKVSGRIGRFDVGALAVRQEAYENVNATTALVGRVAANVLEESSVGMIVTDGDPTSNLSNSVAGIDFRYFNSRLAGGRSVSGEAWVQQSDTEGLAGDDTAAGIHVELPTTAGLGGEVAFTKIDDNFNPALGFVRRRGIDELTLAFGNTWRPRGSVIRTVFSGVDAGHIEYSDNGDVQSEVIEFQALNVELNSQDSFNVGYTQSREGLRSPFTISPGVTIPPGEYSFDQVNLGVRTGQQRAVGGGFFINNGEFYDGERFGDRNVPRLAPEPAFSDEFQLPVQRHRSAAGQLRDTRR